jgi:NNP family nitrate/nitrite transporter-like MFS transporter
MHGITVFPFSDLCTSLLSLIRLSNSQNTSGYSRYSTYSIKTDPDNDDKATEIKLCNFSRPHMRAFHFSWMCFFIAFFIWFSIAPLLGEIRITLNLTKQEIWSSSIASVAGTILLRFINGPLCDKYGARRLMGVILMLACIPTACTGLVNSANGLIAIRFFIGCAGSTFVMCQFWTSRMFTKEVAGTANAIVGGWGNLGGGVTQLVMGALLFPLFKTGMSAEMAWRTVCLVPAAVGLVVGALCIFVTDDAPKGYYKDMLKHGAMPQISATSSFRQGALNFNTWLLFLQYACCFGVELTMNNAAALYFIDVFDMSTEQASAIASLFGWMNLFARGLGGFSSDKANRIMGMRGRIAVQTVLLLGEGIMVFIFAHTKNLGLAIFVMICFSVFVQGAEGSTYGIVPYVNPSATGSIAGIVGAGGNVGAVAFGFGFRQLSYYYAFLIMGGVILLSCFVSIFIQIPGYGGLICGTDSAEAIAERDGTATKVEQELEIPAKNDAVDEE